MIEFQEVSRVNVGQQQVDRPIDPPGMLRSQFETEICLRLKLFEIGFDFSNLRNRPLHFRTADYRSNFRKNTDKYWHLATLGAEPRKILK